MYITYNFMLYVGAVEGEKMIDNLNYYRVFLAVAETGSISRAAERLYISQPAVSKSIKNLEDQLSVHLIGRTARGVELTEQGALLFEHLREAFQSIRTAEDELRQAGDLGIGELKIGASASLCRNILLSYLRDFITSYPHIKVSITCHSTQTTVRKLEEGSIDIGLICETALPEKLSYRPLQEIHDIFVVNPAYLEHLYIREQAADQPQQNPWLFAGNVTSIFHSRKADAEAPQNNNLPGHQIMSTEEILEKCSLMMLEQGNVTRNHLEHYFYEQNIQHGQALDVNNMDLLIDFAKIGMGVSSVVKEFASEALADGSLVELPLRTPVPSRTVGFSLNQQKRKSSSLQKFLEVTAS